MKRKIFLLPGALMLGILLCGCGKRSETPPAVISVRTQTPQLRLFEESVTTRGVVQPVEHATLSSRVQGAIEELEVKAGAKVKAGQMLFRQDRRNLENRRNLAQQTLNMAEERHRTRQVELKIAKLNLEQAKLDYERNRKLFGKEIVAASRMEQYALSYKNARLACEKAQAALLTTDAEIKFARAALEITEKHIEDSIIRAPYNGTITAKLKEEHEFCNPGTPVLKMESDGVKEISMLVSSLYFGRIRAGKSFLRIAFGRKLSAPVPVTYTAPSIDPVSRTFEVKAELPQSLNLPSGALAECSIILASRRSYGVPEDAVLFRAGGKFAVFAADNGKASELSVIPGVSADGFTELLNGKELKERRIVISGQYFLNPGTLLKEE